MVLLDFITKGLNKVIAPKFLQLSLRIHQYVPINAISLLPLSQRLVSIEVQDDYRQLGKPIHGGMLGSLSKSFDDFVERSWNVLGLERVVDRETGTDSKHEVELKKKAGTRERSRTHNSQEYDMTKQNDGRNSRSQERVQLLEQYISPVILDASNDPPQTFVKWIRGEYLIAKYGLHVQEAIRKYPELKDDAAGLSTFDVQTIDGRDAEFPLDLILPTIKTVRRAFNMEDWSRIKVPIASFDENIKEYVGTMSIESIIHNRLQGQVANSGPLNAYFEMRRREDSYELWTKDYIFGLANYILQRIEEMNKQSMDNIETTVLDVGAGDGRLIYFLRRAMNEISASKNRLGIKRSDHQPQFQIPTLIATDDGSWRAPIYKTSHIQVEQLSVIDAIDKYAAKAENKTRLIVICSWMPTGEDWTHHFRQPACGALANQNTDGSESAHKRSLASKKVPAVEEYILIGESDDGTCGHNWYTWGNEDFCPHLKHSDNNAEKPPFVEDGYTRVDLEQLSKLQFSRFDCKRSSESRTVSFRHDIRLKN